MNFNKFLNQVLTIVLVFFAGLVLVSFSVPDETISPGWLLKISMFLENNWVLIALVLSEVASFIPGKPKGILQAILRIGSKLFDNDNESQKRR
jgi:hypothetical protein